MATYVSVIMMLFFFRKLTGHKTVDDYYKQASSCHYLDKVSWLSRGSSLPMFYCTLSTSASECLKLQSLNFYLIHSCCHL